MYASLDEEIEARHIVVRALERMEKDDPQGVSYIRRHLLALDEQLAATLKAAQGGVTDQMLREMCRAYETTAHGFADFTPNERGLQAMRAALEAALSAQQGQGEVDLAGYVDPEQVADMQRNGGGVSIGSFSERYGRTVPVYFHPAPPARPAEVEATLRRILERGKHRTDGDLATLLDRVEHMTRGDQDLIAMQRTEIRLLDERPAQLAERVPEGLLRKALTIAANIRTADWLEAGGTVREQDELAAYLAASPAPSPARGDGGEG